MKMTITLCLFTRRISLSTSFNCSLRSFDSLIMYVHGGMTRSCSRRYRWWWWYGVRTGSFQRWWGTLIRTHYRIDLLKCQFRFLRCTCVHECFVVMIPRKKKSREKTTYDSSRHTHSRWRVVKSRLDPQNWWIRKLHLSHPKDVTRNDTSWMSCRRVWTWLAPTELFVPLSWCRNSFLCPWTRTPPCPYTPSHVSSCWRNASPFSTQSKDSHTPCNRSPSIYPDSCDTWSPYPRRTRSPKLWADLTSEAVSVVMSSSSWFRKK